MKTKTNYFMAMLMMAMLMSACAENRLKVVVATLNGKCPMEWGKATCESVSLDDNTLTFKLTATENDFFEGVKANPSLIDMMAKSLLIGIKKENEKMLQLFVDAKVDFKIVLSSKDGEDKCESEYSSEKMIELLNSQNDANDMMLSSFVEAINKVLPADAGNGMKQTAVLLEEKDLINTYEIDEKEAKMDDLIKEKDTLKASYMVAIRNNPRIFGGKNLLSIVAVSNRNLVFRFISVKSNEKVEVTISNAELKALLK